MDASEVAAVGSNGFTLDYYRSVTEGLNTAQRQDAVLHTNANEQVMISTLWKNTTESVH